MDPLDLALPFQRFGVRIRPLADLHEQSSIGTGRDHVSLPTFGQLLAQLIDRAPVIPDTLYLALRFLRSGSLSRLHLVTL
jgi:hypothetical protein